MRIVALFLAAALCPVVLQVQAASAPEEQVAGTLWQEIKAGKLSVFLRYRFEAFDREGAPFTGTAYAPTMGLTVGYQTPAFRGVSAFVQGTAVSVTGPADYSVPTLPSQNRPDRPAILEPCGIVLNQGYLKWSGGFEKRELALTVGRQEIMLNDGRFVSTSAWRQVHESFDAARLDADLSPHASLTYAFLDRYNRVVGPNATDGKPPMRSHLMNLAWKRAGQVNASLYGLWLDYRSPGQYALSTQTFGLRANGPYQLNTEWSVLYTAEFANQRNFGTNPNRIDVNYYLAEAGPAWRGIGFKTGYALLGGRSITDKLSTPLAQPFNGWTELFVSNPSAGQSHGLEARYLSASGPVSPLGGAVLTATYYDYHSDSQRIHYGSELDLAVACKIRRVSDRWEIGWRFGHYWSDRLYGRALRTSLYSTFTL